MCILTITRCCVPCIYSFHLNQWNKKRINSLDFNKFLSDSDKFSILSDDSEAIAMLSLNIHRKTRTICINCVSWIIPYIIQAMQNAHYLHMDVSIYNVRAPDESRRLHTHFCRCSSNSYVLGMNIGDIQVPNVLLRNYRLAYYWTGDENFLLYAQ